MKIALIDFSKAIKKAKIEAIIEKFKYRYYELNYVLCKEHSSSFPVTFILIIIQYMQIISLTLHETFADNWGSDYFLPISHFFQYFTAFYFFRDNLNVFYIIYILSSLFLFFVYGGVAYCLYKGSQLQLNSRFIKSIIILGYSLNFVIYHPLLKILFITFHCTADKVNYYFQEYKCFTAPHIIIISFNTAFIVIGTVLSYSIRAIFFNNGSTSQSATSKITSICDQYFMILEIILIFSYEFLNQKLFLATITLISSLLLLYTYIGYQPFYNKIINQTIIVFHYCFGWASSILFLSVIIPNDNFTGGIPGLVIGFPLIVGGNVLYSSRHNIEEIILKLSSTYLNSFSYLKQIQLFIYGIENTGTIKDRKNYIMLHGYINHCEMKCNDNNCALKQYWNSVKPVEKEDEGVIDIIDNKVFLLKHADLLYKSAIAGFPNDIQLRLAYSSFLFSAVNKKQRAYIELENTSRLEKSFEEEYLIYKTKTDIQNDVEKNVNDMKEDYESLLIYKNYFLNFKNCIHKVSSLYIEFWSLLSGSEESKTKNFMKMNDGGNRINKGTIEINKTLQKMEGINSKDKEAILIYAQYGSEVINNKKKADKYYASFKELDQAYEKYDENSIEMINMNNMQKANDSMNIIVSALQESFGNVINASLTLCSLLGYTKDDIIGRSIDIIMPEIFKEEHSKLGKSKINVHKNKTMSLQKEDNQKHQGFKMVNVYVKTKAKYIIPLKINAGGVSSENGESYFISKVVEQTTSSPQIYSQEDSSPCIVLTDNDLKIQNFTTNCIKLLNLASGAINNFIDITEFVKELKEDFVTNYLNLEESQGGDKKQKITQYIIQKKYKTPKEITWMLTESIMSNFGKTKDNKNEISEASRGLDIKKIPNDNYLSPNRKEGSASVDKDRKSKPGLVKKKNSFMAYKKMGNDFDLLHQTNEKFMLTIEDGTIGKSHVGYLFRFETLSYFAKTPQNLNTLSTSSFQNLNMISANQSFKSLYNPTNSPPNNRMFNAIMKDKKKTKIVEANFVPEIQSKQHFNLNLNSMAFNKIDLNGKESVTNLRKDLKEMALTRIKQSTEINVNSHKSTTSSDEFFSEYSSSNSESQVSDYSESESMNIIGKKSNRSNNSNNKDNSNVKDNNNTRDGKDEGDKVSLQKGISPQTKDSNNNRGSISNQTPNSVGTGLDFYRINTKHIIYFVYNYKTNSLQEERNSPMLKYSEVDMKTKLQGSKGKISGEANLAEYISNDIEMNKNTLMKRNSNDLINSIEEIESQKEKVILMKQIKKVLANKKTQSTIKQGAVVSVFVFSLFIILVIVSLLIYLSTRNTIIQNSKNCGRAAKLTHIFLNSVFLVRELILLNNPMYENIYDTNRNAYYYNISESIKASYFEIDEILFGLSSNVTNLSEKNQKLINMPNIRLDVGDTHYKYTGNNSYYQYKSYYFAMLPAFIEVNSALYYIGQLSMENAKPLNEKLYFFMKNMVNILTSTSSNLSLFFGAEFFDITAHNKIVNYIQIAIAVIGYTLSYFVGIHFYQKVELKKYSYGTIFYELSHKIVFNSGTKCERFNRKIQLARDNEAKNIVVDESNESESVDFNDLYQKDNLKNNKESIEGKGQNKTEEKKINIMNNNRNKILILAMLLLFLILILIGYIIQIIFQISYNNYAHYISHQTKYNLVFYSIFVFIREVMFDSAVLISNVYGGLGVNNGMINIYSLLNTEYVELERYSQYMPSSFNEEYGKIKTKPLCDVLDQLMSEIPLYNITDSETTCDSFASSSLNYGLTSFYSYYIEDIRTLKQYYDIYNDQITYIPIQVEFLNNTLFNTPFYDKPREEWDKFPELVDILNQIHTYHLFNRLEHKESVIIYRFILNTYSLKIHAFIEYTIFDVYRQNMIITISYFTLFGFFLIVSYFFIWTPFVGELNETIYQTKNMGAIIPKEGGISIPQTKKMLGLDKFDKKKDKKKFLS